MRKLVFILLAFLAIFTYIRTSEKVEAGEASFSTNDSENQTEVVREPAKLANSNIQPQISIDE